MRYFLNTIERSDIVKGIDGGTETSVETENLVLNQSGERKIVEKVGKVLPDIRVSIFAQTFVVESVDLCDLSGFVVSTKDCDALGITNFQCNEECNSLNGIVSTVNIVTWILSALRKINIRFEDYY